MLPFVVGEFSFSSPFQLGTFLTSIGAIAQAKGVSVLQPIVLAILVAILALWCMLPGGFKKSGLDNLHWERDEGRAAAVEEGEANGVQGKVARLRVKIFGVQ